MLHLPFRKMSFIALTAPAIMVAAGCDKSDAKPPVSTTRPVAAATNQVAIDNFSFTPATLTVPAGTTVTWINHDDVPHTVTSSANPRVFASKALDTDDRFSQVFTTPGTYSYFCAIHPHMTATIIVR